jgi:hypothetical protein
VLTPTVTTQLIDGTLTISGAHEALTGHPPIEHADPAELQRQRAALTMLGDVLNPTITDNERLAAAAILRAEALHSTTADIFYTAAGPTITALLDAHPRPDPHLLAARLIDHSINSTANRLLLNIRVRLTAAHALNQLVDRRAANNLDITLDDVIADWRPRPTTSQLDDPSDSTRHDYVSYIADTADRIAHTLTGYTGYVIADDADIFGGDWRAHSHHLPLYPCGETDVLVAGDALLVAAVGRSRNIRNLNGTTVPALNGLIDTRGSVTIGSYATPEPRTTLLTDSAPAAHLDLAAVASTYTQLDADNTHGHHHTSSLLATAIALHTPSGQ